MAVYATGGVHIDQAISGGKSQPKQQMPTVKNVAKKTAKKATKKITKTTKK